MSLFEGSAPPNVETTRVTAAQAPGYLTDYLTKLASSGQAQLGAEGKDLVAAPSFLQEKAYQIAPSALTGFQEQITDAASAARGAIKPIAATDISAFYDPYQQDVIDKMTQQSAQNVQRNLLPQLRGAFGGTGAFGSQRYAGAIGQALGDIQSDLLAQQAKYRSAGFQSALDAALRQKTGQTAAASALGNIGAQQQTAVTTGLKTLSELGGQQQAYEQAKIEAPTIRAQNIAQILRGYTYPTTTTETYKGPANAYQPSPLAQIAGLGALLGSGFSSSSGWGNKLFGGIADIFKGLGGNPAGLSYNPGSGYGTGTTSTGLNIYDQGNYEYDPNGP